MTQNLQIQLLDRDSVRSGGLGLRHLPIRLLLLPGDKGFREDGGRIHMSDHNAYGSYQCPCLVVGVFGSIQLRSESLNQSTVYHVWYTPHVLPTVLFTCMTSISATQIGVRVSGGAADVSGQDSKEFQHLQGVQEEPLCWFLDGRTVLSLYLHLSGRRDIQGHR